MSKRRNSALVAALMVGTVLTPVPAGAFSLGSLFGGGGGGGMACGNAEGLGGLIAAGAGVALDLFTGGMGSVYLDQAIGAIDTADDIAGDLLGGGQDANGTVWNGTPGAQLVASEQGGVPEQGGKGNCVMERKPFVVEDTLATMRKVGLHNVSPEINAALQAAQWAINMADRVQWQVAAANADFQQMYPYVLPAATPQQIVAHRTEQEQLAKENSRSSKLGTSALMEDVLELRARIADLLAASKQCHDKGQTCAIDVNTQMVALNAELTIRAMTIDATGNRASEGLLDYLMASQERAKAAWRISNRGLGGDGDAGGESTDGWLGM
jgi:hypothetical protein